MDCLLTVNTDEDCFLMPIKPTFEVFECLEGICTVLGRELCLSYYMYITVYIYTCMCVCVFVFLSVRGGRKFRGVRQDGKARVSKSQGLDLHGGDS